MMKKQLVFKNLTIPADGTSDPVMVAVSDYELNGFFSLDLSVVAGKVKIYYKAGNVAGAGCVPVEGGGVIVTQHSATSGDAGRKAYPARIGAFRMVEIYAEALDGNPAEIAECVLNMI
ncbi:hypothetical protein OO185_02520 [Prosthecochloris sp. SCSIO W1102]|uniref:hypothetical protein n=1 Tax=Prosthecochloris sp. SCSIO W1102 TaxID=2992243 RepID=UPI00223DE981|nr:hypothetical protein [Prosthecochloris sp. SCSIO W1102]UZJ39995.1 hypothetical protein OO185_02520 [Prosthecochloris sp. SCSIO W1102]